MAFKLTPPTEQERWFKGSHMFTGILDDNQKLFLGGVDDQYVKMVFAYGIEGIDRDKNLSGERFNIYKPNENRGSVIFNTNFDITNALTQADILDPGLGGPSLTRAGLSAEDMKTRLIDFRDSEKVGVGRGGDERSELRKS